MVLLSCPCHSLDRRKTFLSFFLTQNMPCSSSDGFPYKSKPSSELPFCLWGFGRPACRSQTFTFRAVGLHVLQRCWTGWGLPVSLTDWDCLSSELESRPFRRCTEQPDGVSSVIHDQPRTFKEHLSKMSFSLSPAHSYWFPVITFLLWISSFYFVSIFDFFLSVIFMHWWNFKGARQYVPEDFFSSSFLSLIL